MNFPFDNAIKIEFHYIFMYMYIYVCKWSNIIDGECENLFGTKDEFVTFHTRKKATLAFVSMWKCTRSSISALILAFASTIKWYGVGVRFFHRDLLHRHKFTLAKLQQIYINYYYQYYYYECINASLQQNDLACIYISCSTLI